MALDDETANEADQTRADVGRRGMFAALLGLGAAGVAACGAQDADESWADTVLGSGFPGTRNGDLSTKTAAQIGPASRTVVVVAKGCCAAGDGGGGLFYWDTSGGTDDGGTFIVPNSSGIGAVGSGWRRIHDGVLNVKWFGARGDFDTSATDNTKAIQSAVDSLGAGGGVVFLPPGRYGFGPASAGPKLTIHGGTRMAGANGASALMSPQLALDPFVQLDGLGPNVIIEDIAFVAAQGTAGVGIHTNGAANCSIVNCTFLGPLGQAILVYSSTNTRITACHFEGVGSGLGGPTPGDAINVYAASSRTAAGCIIASCTFYRCGQDAAYFNAADSTATLADCVFSGNSVIGMPQGVQIKSGVNIAVVGNTFEIRPPAPGGCAAVPVVFGVVVQSPSTQSADCVIADNVFRFDATGGLGCGPQRAAVSIDSNCQRASVTGNTVTPGFQYGITTGTTGGDPCPANCIISGNTIHGDASMVFGISLASGSTGPQSNVGANYCVVSANTISGAGAVGGRGINCQARYCTIANNTVTGIIGAYGIDLTGTRCCVMGNTVYCAGAVTAIHEGNDAGGMNTIVGNACGSLASTGAGTVLSANIIG